MPRIGRTPLPGTVHHVITRFVDRSWLLAGDEEREAYLLRLDRALKRSDWRLLAFALMSNHVHLVLEAGHGSLAAWAKSVHSAMARWLNVRRRGLGPVFADRPYAEAVAPDRVPHLIAYVHNNPVRAGLVPWAGECNWTTHRAYLRLEEAVAVQVSRGLELCGYADDPDGFDEWVRACAQVVEVDGFRSPARAREALSNARRSLGGPAQLATPQLTSEGLEYPIAVMTPTTVGPVCVGVEASDVVQYVDALTGVSPLGMSACDHRRDVSAARRAAMLAWQATGRPRIEMARSLGISHQAAAKLLKSADPDSVAVAQRVADALGLNRRCSRESCA